MTQDGSTGWTGAMVLDDRDQWIARAERLAGPVLEALAAGRLRRDMPVEHRDPGKGKRTDCSHLETLGRLLAGLAPWFGREADEPRAARWADLAREGIAAATDPDSPDYMNFSEGIQPLVDAAFLGHAVLRAPAALWDKLDPAVQRRFVEAMRRTRAIKPGRSNWLLFSAMVEAFLARAGEDWDPLRVDYAIAQFDQWYKGDGAYGDGAALHFDYYNSFVIQPMLLDVLAEVGRHRNDWAGHVEPVTRRAQRYAVVLERFLAPDGSYPALGRSITYRCGAFQLLGHLALADMLPDALPPGQVRAALGAVIRRTLDVPGTFDADGWLRIGLSGHQPMLSEGYISTGSLYLCSTALLPLGLDPTAPFWTDRRVPFTGQRLWAGHDEPPDHFMAE